MRSLCIVCFLLCLLIIHCFAGKKKKDPRDFTDADIYKLEEEWTVKYFVNGCSILMLFW